jgi:hypothetical protein
VPNTLKPNPRTATQVVSSIEGTRVELETEGRMAANVVVCMDGDLVLMRFDVAHGNLPPSIRRRLVEQAFQLPQFGIAQQHVQAVIPLGDVELLQGLRAHLTDLRTRAAGASCLIEASTRAV